VLHVFAFMYLYVGRLSLDIKIHIQCVYLIEEWLYGKKHTADIVKGCFDK